MDGQVWTRKGYQPQPLKNYPQPPPGYQPIPQHQMPYGPPGHQQPIVTQPGYDQGGWMPMPTGIPNCPPGLEYLTTIDQLLVKQEIELTEIVTGFETHNRYTIKNIVGQRVYYAIEDNDWFTLNCYGSLRPFDMKIFDNYNKEVIHLYRPYACQGCCCPCCLQSIEISSPPGTIIGSVHQKWAMCSTSYLINNHMGEPILRIEGPCCICGCCGDVEFKVMSLTGEQMGKITKQWTGLVREMYTDADFFGITFPLDLDVRTKAILLGALFLIDFMFFERTGKR